MDITGDSPQLSVYQGKLKDANPELKYCLFTIHNFTNAVPGVAKQIFKWQGKTYALNCDCKIFWLNNDAWEEIGNSAQKLFIEGNRLFAMVGTTKYKFNGNANDWTAVLRVFKGTTYTIDDEGLIYWQKNGVLEVIGNSATNLLSDENELWVMCGTLKYKFNGKPHDWTLVPAS